MEVTDADSEQQGNRVTAVGIAGGTKGMTEEDGSDKGSGFAVSSDSFGGDASKVRSRPPPSRELIHRAFSAPSARGVCGSYSCTRSPRAWWERIFQSGVGEYKSRGKPSSFVPSPPASAAADANAAGIVNVLSAPAITAKCRNAA